ncbi:serine/threonine-protein phosphatase [Geminocystis sp. GBBB08]|uniref:PP2C family protein-serine/threonine phosphatase n=1 Tax=Geminocystis sp. GBBB08 TaxID=2604140 RepID=UPI0027E2A91C|nr:serine/threonine-protein phosphatase [Geminocystis sp. GBBB08]MBL1211312.1 serine/threonine-protein phosphatase [Geminocystis sp. GBBB08]
MTTTIAEIRCINKRCKALNLLENTFCHRCQTPLVKRYLRIIGTLTKEYGVGELIENRFFVCQPNVVIDTKPSIVPIFPETVSDEITPYLKLFSHRLHIPQVYGCIDKEYSAWLLEYENIPLNETGNLVYPDLFPAIEFSFFHVSPLRQVNWLWQMVLLWKPLARQKVLSSLFLPNNLKVAGGIIKIIELKFDHDSNPNLKDLANLWEVWFPKFNPLIQEVMGKIILSIQQNILDNSDKILAIFDQVLYILGNSYYQRKYQIITASDPGKKRANNEDSCFPKTNNLKNTRSSLETLAIVCDGLGGQEDGEIASKMAIEIMKKELEDSYKKTLKETLQNKYWTPLIDAEKIYNAVSKANDEITNINNIKKRKDKERMGTTTVITMAIAHEIYLAHVGDSRIYWVTEDSCHQVTADDDLATREVRLGNGFYRQVIRNSQTGALLQALGMESSRRLKVHIRRFILDENCVFLLCSDGLSDYERVEQYWMTEILPIIKQEINIEEAAKKILDIGINKNGHDNVTIALVHCQLEEKKPDEHDGKLSWKYLEEIMPDLPQPNGGIKFKKTENINDNFSKNPQLNQQTIILIISLIVIIIGFLFWYNKKSSQNNSMIKDYLIIVIVNSIKIETNLKIL